MRCHAVSWCTTLVRTWRHVRLRCVQGQYQVELAARGTDGANLLCLIVDFTIDPPSLTSVLRGDPF